VRHAFARLAKECRNGALSFPSPVYGELGRGHDSLASKADASFEWIQANTFAQLPDPAPLDDVREILALVPMLLDHTKTCAADDADPFMVALAVKQKKKGKMVTVISDDRRDELYATSIQTGCGIFARVPSTSWRRCLRLTHHRGEADQARESAIAPSPPHHHHHHRDVSLFAATCALKRA
jgi:hypothetical protein